MIEKSVLISTNAGKIDSSLFLSDKKDKPFIIFYMDAPAIREELRNMCRRISAEGYNVILPNLFYRLGTEGNYPFNQDTYKSDKKELGKMVKTMNDTSNNMIINDTSYILDFIENEMSNKKKIGIVGYCMSGRFVVACGAAYSSKIKSIASFYGVDIYTQLPDSPHLSFNKIKGEIYLAFAEKDVWVSDEQINKIKEAISMHNISARIEIYKGTTHGFAFPERANYDQKASEKHWEELFALFKRSLF